MNKPETRVRAKISAKTFNRAKVKAHFRDWAASVKMNNMAHRIPESLLDSLNPELDKYVNEALVSLGLININGFWERKD